MTDNEEFLACIKTVCNDLYFMLEQKNKAYGNSAVEPIRVFSNLDADAGIRVRLDDKLSRLRNLGTEDDEDTIKDLIGYLILLVVYRTYYQTKTCKTTTTLTLL